jgi:hypothetical protein
MTSSSIRTPVAGFGYQWSKVGISQRTYGVSAPTDTRRPDPVREQEVDTGRLEGREGFGGRYRIAAQINGAQQRAEQVPVGSLYQFPQAVGPPRSCPVRLGTSGAGRAPQRCRPRWHSPGSGPLKSFG